MFKFIFIVQLIKYISVLFFSYQPFFINSGNCSPLQEQDLCYKGQHPSRCTTPGRPRSLWKETILVTSPRQITGQFVLPVSPSHRFYDLTVTNLDGSSGTRLYGFEVTWYDRLVTPPHPDPVKTDRFFSCTAGVYPEGNHVRFFAPLWCNTINSLKSSVDLMISLFGWCIADHKPVVVPNRNYGTWK